MKTEFQNFIDMLDNADILYSVGKYTTEGAKFVLIGETEFYFTLDGKLETVVGY